MAGSRTDGGRPRPPPRCAQPMRTSVPQTATLPRLPPRPRSLPEHAGADDPAMVRTGDVSPRCKCRCRADVSGPLEGTLLCRRLMATDRVLRVGERVSLGNRCPWIVLRQQHDTTVHPLDKDLFALTAELLGQAHGLHSTILDTF